jgi:hypothetical protein
MHGERRQEPFDGLRTGLRDPVGSWRKERPGDGMRLVSPTDGETLKRGMAKPKARHGSFSQVGLSDRKKESRGSKGSRINS